MVVVATLAYFICVCCSCRVLLAAQTNEELLLQTATAIVLDHIRSNLSQSTNYSYSIAPKPKPLYKIRKEIIDELFTEYHKSVRPHPDPEGPTVVAVNLFIRSISSINELSMQFTADLLVRQLWNDPRLRYKVPQAAVEHIPFVKLGSDAAKYLWLPDLFFPAERQGQRHTITVPNVMIRVYPNGTILFSERFSLVIACSMNLVKYPFDQQECAIQLGSFSDTTDSLLFTWVAHKPISVNTEVRLPKFSIGDVKTLPCLNLHPTGNFSCLKGELQLKRQLGFYLVESYLPTTLLVIASWLGFWIDASSVPGRVCLSVTTLLTTVAQTTNIKNHLPPVSYVKAIDVWCCICIFYVFMTLVEFSFANYLDYLAEQAREESTFAQTQKAVKKPIPSSWFSYMANSGKTRNLSQHSTSAAISRRYKKKKAVLAQPEAMNGSGVSVVDVQNIPPLSMPNANNNVGIGGKCPKPPNSAFVDAFATCNNNGVPRSHHAFFTNDNHADSNAGSCEQIFSPTSFDRSKQIDRVSRVLFPFTFILVSVFYAYFFTYALD